jgi:hypothetical protein
VPQLRRLSFRVVLLAGVATLYRPAAGQVPDAASVLAAARTALGGEQKLSAVKSFIVTGRTRQLRGNNLVPIEFEISCELPDKFVRTDEIPAQDTDPSTVGFNGDQLIQVPPPPPPPPPAPATAQPAPGPGPGRGGGRGGGPPRIIGAKQDFARLTLGMFAASFPGYPLTFKYAALGQAPEGEADVLDVAGPANFSARFVVQRTTHLPVMLMWQMPSPKGPVEHRIYYGDFREVDGLKLPFRIRRAVGGETIEETIFDRYRINPKIDPRKFAPRK